MMRKKVYNLIEIRSDFLLSLFVQLKLIKYIDITIIIIIIIIIIIGKQV